MSTFIVGDTIRCINSGDFPFITEGKVYTIQEVGGEFLRIIDDEGTVGGYRHTRFELVPQVNEFKVGDTVRCINDEGYPITQGAVYIVEGVAGEFLRVIDDGVSIGGYRCTRFELVRDHVLTPEEVFKHLRKGTKLEWSDKGTDDWYTVHSNRDVLVWHIETLQWRIKPVPEIIEANGRKYKLIEE